jgi:hypothetical protein
MSSISTSGAVVGFGVHPSISDSALATLVGLGASHGTADARPSKDKPSTHRATAANFMVALNLLEDARNVAIEPSKQREHPEQAATTTSEQS